MTTLVDRSLDHQAPHEEPATPGLVAGAAGGLFGAISSLRQNRSLHPEGIVFEARYSPRDGSRAGVRLLDEPQRAIVRMSRALGLPSALPDILGLTVRFPDAHGRGRHQDFPLATSGDGPLAHHLLLPATSFFALPYSSVLAYDIAGATRLLGALSATERPARGRHFDQLLRTDEPAFDLALSTLGGRFRPIGRLTLEERVPPEQADKIRFNPWNTGGGIRPTGPFMGLRAGAYRGSQAGWHA
jgi:hypothetical protein